MRALPRLALLPASAVPAPPCNLEGSSVPTAAVSSTSTTATVTTTAETGPTSLTAVSTPASWVEEEAGWEELLGERG